MNEKKLLRIAADLILAYLGEDSITEPVETGELGLSPPALLEQAPVKVTESLDTQEEEAVDTKDEPPPVSDLELKNQEIERLKEELSKAQLNSFNFKPIGGTDG